MLRIVRFRGMVSVLFRRAMLAASLCLRKPEIDIPDVRKAISWRECMEYESLMRLQSVEISHGSLHTQVVHDTLLFLLYANQSHTRLCLLACLPPANQGGGRKKVPVPPRTRGEQATTTAVAAPRFVCPVYG